jgi:hypothetical protein
MVMVMVMLVVMLIRMSTGLIDLLLLPTPSPHCYQPLLLLLLHPSHPPIHCCLSISTNKLVPSMRACLYPVSQPASQSLTPLTLPSISFPQPTRSHSNPTQSTNSIPTQPNQPIKLFPLPLPLPHLLSTPPPPLAQFVRDASFIFTTTFYQCWECHDWPIP